MRLRGVNSELRSLSELMGLDTPSSPSDVLLYKRPVSEAPKDDAPTSDGLPKDVRDAAFRDLAAASGFAKGGTPEGDAATPAPAKAPTKAASPVPAKPADEKPAAKTPVENPAAAAPVEKPATTPPAEKPAAKAPAADKTPAASTAPAAEKPPAEQPPEAAPDKDGETDAPPTKWRIPMDTVFGRTPQSDLERYLKTIAATLQAQEGMDIEAATKHIEVVVDAMTKANLLPPIKPNSPDEEVDVWMDAAMARGLASVILDRA